MTFDEWCTIVKHHDLTYAYSDDASVYSRGRSVYDLIMHESLSFPQEDCARVWNAMVDRFLIPEARAPFYWRYYEDPPTTLAGTIQAPTTKVTES